MKLKGVAQVEAVFEALRKFPTAVVEEFKQGADQIRDVAQNYAPVDDGHLESAIKVSPLTSKGPGNLSLSVYIDENVADVGDYAVFMHEGSYSLGPKSQAKADALGVPVGPKFLTRAAKKVMPEMKKAIEKVAGELPATVRATVKGVRD
jgi:hypothetical protein